MSSRALAWRRTSRPAAALAVVLALGSATLDPAVVQFPTPRHWIPPLAAEAGPPRASDAPSGTAGRPDADALIARAMATHPELRANALRGRAVVGEAQAMRSAWPNPSFVVEGGLSVMGAEGTRRAMVGVEQAFPWPGMRDADADAMVAEVPVIEAEREDWERALSFRVRGALLQVARLRAERRLLEADRAARVALLGFAESTLAWGASSARDLGALVRAVTEMDDRIDAVVAEEAMVLARLSGAVGWPSDVALDPELGEFAALLAAIPAVRDAAALEAAANARGPGLRKIEAMGDVARFRASAADRRRWPMVMGMVGWERMTGGMAGMMPDGDHVLVAGLTVPLPLDGDRWDRLVEVEQVRGDIARAEADAMRWMYRAEIGEALVRIERARGAVARIDGALGRALAFDADQIIADLPAMGMGWDMLIENAMERLDLGMRRLEAHFAAAEAIEQLRWLTGGSPLVDDPGPASSALAPVTALRSGTDPSSSLATDEVPR